MSGFQRILFVLVALVGIFVEGIATLTLSFAVGFLGIMAYMVMGLSGLWASYFLFSLWLTIQLGVVYLIARISMRLASQNLQVFWTVFVGGLLTTLLMIWYQISIR